ncbi:MAG: Zn-ribbon domain-containing OB-fold protein [Candidatus Hydrogenedentota bacterium]|nr:MAG: Zn-ribbon domain-containing OB-fold protein [Candidatus Hydrogenedentota bacterium]
MPPAKSWRAYPQTYRLEAGRCKKCGKVSFPPRLICNKCQGREFEHFEMRRTGKVVTHTVIRTPADEFSGEAPFAVGIIEMDDGARLTTQIADVSFEEIEIGMPVKLEFRRHYTEGEAGIIHYGHKAVPVRG